jgi:hypothetical protein
MHVYHKRTLCKHKHIFTADAHSHIFTKPTDFDHQYNTQNTTNTTNKNNTNHPNKIIFTTHDDQLKLTFTSYSNNSAMNYNNLNQAQFCDDRDETATNMRQMSYSTEGRTPPYDDQVQTYCNSNEQTTTRPMTHPASLQQPDDHRRQLSNIQTGYTNYDNEAYNTGQRRHQPQQPHRNKKVPTKRPHHEYWYLLFNRRHPTSYDQNKLFYTKLKYLCHYTWEFAPYLKFALTTLEPHTSALNYNFQVTISGPKVRY